MRKLLIVSPHFPPTHAPDSQRTLGALPYLKELGWDATVLCVDSRDVAAPIDAGLAASLAADVRVIRVRAIPLWIGKLAGTRTLSWRAKTALYRAGRKFIGESAPDLVLFSTTQYPLLTLGPKWQNEFQVPFAVDLQDPWLTDYYSRPGSPPAPGGWKYTFAHAIAKWLEPKTFSQAAGFVSVSGMYLSDLEARYTWFSAKPKVVIPFGIDVGKFAAAVASGTPVVSRTAGLLNIVSVGAAGPIMSRAATALFEQLASLRRSDPQLAARLRFHFIGTSYAPPGKEKESIAPIAAALGVGDQVLEIPGRIIWESAQATLGASDGLVVLTSDDAGYTPSKIAGCFLARRPCLVVAGSESGASILNSRLGLGVRLDPFGGTPGALKAFVEELSDPSESWKQKRKEATFADEYTAKARTTQLAVFMDSVSPNPGPIPTS